MAKQQDVVATLEAALEKAKAGQILAVAIATIETEKLVGNAFVTNDHWVELLGATFALCRDIVADPDRGD